MLPKQNNLPLARRMAVEGILKSGPGERAARGGARFEPGMDGEGRILLPYLGRGLSFSVSRGEIELRNGGDPLSLREEILVLHYLENASGIPATGQWVSFAEIPGGTFYHPVFLLRGKTPLVKHFGREAQRLLTLATDEMGGKPLALGDAGVRIPAFPRVDIGLVLWKGDEEFPPDGNILFDSSITGYLPVEDIVILAETVVWKLIKKSQASSLKSQVS
jgi:Domain of unknown function (DUF3786)